MPYFCQVDDWLGGLLVVISASGETQGKYSDESRHEAHIFQIFHCSFVLIFKLLISIS